MSERTSRILAVDFDGTLVTNKYPEIGMPNTELFRLCIHAREHGMKIILWTCRNKEYLDGAVAFCRAQGLEFDAVNDNLEEITVLYGGNTRKVFADRYVDDRNINTFIDTVSWVMGAEVEADLWQ